MKNVATNRQASHDYELLERFEAGLALTGREIKSVRANKVNLQRSFVQNRDGELWLMEAHISPYEHASHEKHEPTRPRKLLLHRREINKIIEALTTKGLTMVPTRLYLKDGLAKIEVALARGKKKYDKRAAMARRDSDRQVERALREKYR
ncbi:MAG: SsrA-binding protein SmpB [Chloroflexi bacterium]|nr:SsrA-binding protein SmpB [Chloroflexota bacterium]MCI0727106.1 SsrA-binding protein SmpB [Chloroflexota bacterium]